MGRQSKLSRSPASKPAAIAGSASPPLAPFLYFVIFAVAFILRAAAIWVLGPLPISRTPQLDSLEYLLWAQRIAADGFAWPQYPEHAPGYPFFLGMLLAIFGGSLEAVRVVQAWLGAVCCVLTARVAARTLTPRALVPAGLLQAVYAPFIYLDTALLAEPLLIFLLMLGLDIASGAGVRPRRWLVAGLALGAASIVRPTALVAVVAVAFVLLWGGRVTRPTAFRPLAALALGTALVITPVLIQNWRVTGIPLIQAYGGMNFYLGNDPASDGAARARPGEHWDRLEGEASRAGTTRNEQDAYFVRRAARAIADQPAGYLRLLATKLLWVTQNEELRDTHSFYFFRDEFSLLGWLPGFGVLLGLAVVGVLAYPSLTAPRWLLALLIASAVTLLLLVVGLRYRAPMVPALAAFGGAGLTFLTQWVRQRDWKRVVTAAVVFAGVVAGAHVRTDAASRNVAEEAALTGLALLGEGDLTGAEAAYRRAIALDPRSSYAPDGLGLVLQRTGKRDEARAAFERAVAVNPSNAMAWHHLGLTFEQEKDIQNAIQAYKKSLEIAPERTDVIFSLGNAFFVQGSHAEAAPLFRKAADRGHGRAHLGLAIIALQLGEATSALARAREAVRLLPTDGLAWEILARAANASGLRAEAEQALIAARRFGR